MKKGIFPAAVMGFCLCSFSFVYADINEDLAAAVEEGDLAKVKRLVQQGADINTDTMTGDSLINTAADKGFLPIVKYLIEEMGVNVNAAGRAYDMGPLYSAAAKNRLDVAAYLLKKGAKVNAGNRFNMTPLFEPAGKGYIDMMKMLLNAGADINARNMYGETPLFYAVRGFRGKTSVESINFLISSGADRTIKNNKGKRAADIADEQTKAILAEDEKKK
ncbi:MAG: ankyrin repeat domain-containing protein [Spirochaetota bacterium]